MSIYVDIDIAPAVLELDSGNESDIVRSFAKMIREGNVIELAIPGQQVKHVLVNLAAAKTIGITQEQPDHGTQTVRFQLSPVQVF